MVYRNFERSYDTELISSFGESMSGAIELPRDRRIQELSLDVTMAVLNGANGQTMTKRQLFSILDNITLKVNGQVGNISVEGVRYFDFVKYLMGREPTIIQNEVPIAEGATVSITDATTDTIRMIIPFFFKKNVRNPYDVSGLLDAFGMSSLRLEVSTRSGWLPADTDMTITEASSNVRAVLKEVVADDATLKTINKLNGYGDEFCNVFYHQTQDKTLTTSTGLANSHDIQTGYIHQQIMLHSWDNSAANYVNDIIDKIRIKQTGSNGDIDYLEENWEDSQAEDAYTYGLHVISRGATMWDAETKVGGLDARNLKTGDLKVYYTTGGTVQSGSDQLDLMYKSYIPVKLDK